MPRTSEPKPTPEQPERVQKVLARAGIGSRRACEELIVAGRVTVDERPVVLGDRVDAARQRLAVDGVPVVTRPDLVYYLLNKPAGYVSTASDPEGRPTVVELVPREPRVFSVGRLDADTEGLIILTNDGELTQLLTHPRHGVPKTYLAEVDGVPTAGALRTLRRGVALDDGTTAPHMRRTWRLRPSWMVSSSAAPLSRRATTAARAGAVKPSSSATP